MNVNDAIIYAKTYWTNREDRITDRQVGLALLSELERLRAIVDRLPVTADGVRVVPGDLVWRWRRVVGIGGQTVGADMGLEECEVWDHCDGCACMSPPSVSFSSDVQIAKCYSTRAAAEAAAKENSK